MNAHGTVAASMIYIGVLAILSAGWLTKMREFVSRASGNTP